MAISSPSELFAALERSDTDKVVGTPESEWLEFKQEPYNLAEDYQKIEFVKDLTALANVRGGVLVLGFKTLQDKTAAREHAAAVTLIAKDRVNLDQYRDVAAQWTYPPLRNLVFKWWVEAGSLGVLTIEIPAATDAERPILATHLDTNPGRRGLLVGAYQRTGDRVSQLQAAEIHADIQAGRIARRFGTPATPSVLSLQGPGTEERDSRLEADTRDAGFAGVRRYYLQAWPLGQCEVKDLHATGPSSLRERLSRPQEIRPMGFGLPSRADPSVIEGGGLRIIIEHGSLSVLRSGLLTWIARADSQFLAWADDQRRRVHSINPMALVESTLEFVRFFVLEVQSRCDPLIAKWAVSGGMADLHEGGERSALAAGQLGQYPPNRWQEAPSDTMSIGPLEFGTEAPGQIAYRILREIYVQFGIDEADIPYVENQEVSEELIRQAR